MSGLVEKIEKLEAELRTKEANRVEAEAESIRIWDELQRHNAEVGRLLTRESQLAAEVAKLRQATTGLLEHAIDGGRKAAFAVLHDTLAEDGACVCPLCVENNKAIAAIRFAREVLGHTAAAGEGKDQV